MYGVQLRLRGTGFISDQGVRSIDRDVPSTMDARDFIFLVGSLLKMKKLLFKSRL